LKANAQGCGKKAYEKPVLRIYGDVRSMTQAVSSSAMNKDGKMIGPVFFKTH
jgi:hypothetical protein